MKTTIRILSLVLTLAATTAYAEEGSPFFAQPSGARPPGMETAPCDAAFLDGVAIVDDSSDIRDRYTPADVYDDGDSGPFFSESDDARGDREDGI